MQEVGGSIPPSSTIINVNTTKFGTNELASNHFIYDRRDNSERRTQNNISQFPIITTQGRCIRQDRRSTPERRISNIVVKEWQIKESVFDFLFENSLESKEEQGSN